MKNTQITACHDIYNSVKKMKIDSDLTLPDYCSDISRVVHTESVPQIKEKKVYLRDSAMICEVSGEVANNVIYLTDSGASESVNYTTPFFDSTKISLGSTDADGVVCTVSPSCENPVCKVQSPRRVSVKCDLLIDIKLSENRSINVFVKDSQSVEAREKQVGCMKLSGSRDADFKLSQDIKLPKSCLPMERILSLDVRLCPESVKCGEGVVNFWATAGVTCVYLAEDDGGVQSFYQALELKGEIEADNARSDSAGFVNMLVGKCEGEIDTDDFGESRVFKITVPYTVQCRVADNFQVTLTDDIYGVGCDAQPELDKCEFCEYSGTLRESTAVKEKIVLKKAIDRVEGAVASVVFKDVYFENGELYTDSRVDFRALGISGAQPSLISESFEIAVHLNLPSEFDAVRESLKLDICQYAGFCDVRLDSDGFFVSFDIETVADVFVCESVQYVSGVELRESPVSNSDTVFYYPNESDTLWSVGKRFSVPIAQIVKNNSLTDDKLKRVLKI